MPTCRSGGKVTSERSSASLPKISSPPKPTGMAWTVSKRQTNTRSLWISSAGSPVLTSAALTPSRSHGASGVAMRPRVIAASRRPAAAGEYGACRLRCAALARPILDQRPRPRSARRARLRRPRRATHEDAGAVTSIDLGIDIFKNHHAAVEGDDLSILRPRRASGRTDIVPARRAALQPQLLQLARIGEVHHHSAVCTLADHVGLLALAAGDRKSTRLNSSHVEI